MTPSLQATTRRSRRTVLGRMRRVVTFDQSVYAEVESDPAGTRQAALVVTVVAAVAALGTVLLGDWRPGAILGAVLTALIHWLGWCGVDDLIGRALFRRPLSLQRLVRSLGYAQTPQLLAVLAFVPIVGVWVLLGSRLLTMVAGNQAIGHAFDTRLPQALALRMVSFAIAFATAAAVRAMFGDISFVSAILQP